MTRFLLLVAALFPAITLSATEEWVQVHQNAGGDTISVDKATIKREQGVVRYTEKMVFTNPRPFGNGIHLKTLISSYSVRCADRTTATLGGESITDTGQHITVTPPTTVTYKPINTTSPDALTFAYVCKEN